MQKKTARIILVLVAGLWIVTVWALSVGAVEPDQPQGLQTCIEDICLPGEEEEDSPSPSGSATPSASATPSRSATPSASGSASPRPSGSASPTASSPSPSPSQTTPPPPQVRTFDSRISISYRGGDFKGRVTSESGRCEGARKVVLKKVKKGKDANVGRDTTNRQGKWSDGKRNARGRYYAKVTHKQFRGGENTTIRCKAARSRTIRP